MLSKNKGYLSKSALRRQFAFITNCSYGGVKGVWRIDSGKPGPVLGITLHTHGNEPSGLAVLSYFRTKFDLEKNLKRGTVFFVLNNPLATRRFLHARSKQAKKDARFVSVNMNRLPKDVMTRRHDFRYEIKRAQMLQSIWSEFNFGFDIHSMTQQSQPMIMNIGKIHRDLIRGFPIEIIISNIENVQLQKPAVSFYGTGRIPVMGVETGSHEDPTAFRRAIICTKSLMQNLRLIGGRTKNARARHEEYFVAGSVIFPDDSFELVKTFKTYERITRGQVLAIGNGTEIKAPFNGHVLFCPAGTKPNSIEEEVMFLTHPLRTITLD